MFTLWNNMDMKNEEKLNFVIQIFTKFHSLSSCDSFWNFQLHIWCSLKSCFVLLLCKAIVSVTVVASMEANNALRHHQVPLPAGSAPGISRPPATGPQACCVPHGTRTELSSDSHPHRVYHKSSTPVKWTAWRFWAHWPVWKVETYLENHWEEAPS